MGVRGLTKLIHGGSFENVYSEATIKDLIDNWKRYILFLFFIWFSYPNIYFEINDFNIMKIKFVWFPEIYISLFWKEGILITNIFLKKIDLCFPIRSMDLYEKIKISVCTTYMHMFLDCLHISQRNIHSKFKRFRWYLES